MALIAMAVHDTDENKRSDLTKQTLECLYDTVDFDKHRLIIIDNDSCQRTKDLLNSIGTWRYSENLPLLFTNSENVGTAKAINQALRLRKPGEYVVKMDNDVIIDTTGWIDDMEDVIHRMPKIGILGLKRNDLGESTYSVNTDLRSRLLEVPHENGQRWRVVEECKHIMGTCTMLNPALLDRVGFFYQMDGLYGFDDSLLCVRSNVGGFLNCFLHGIDIDHIDPGQTDYQVWKSQHARGLLDKYGETERRYRSGELDIYYGGE